MKMKDVKESKRARKLVGAKAHRCYLNAFRVIQEVPEYANADYVEGMAVLGGLPVEHGWVEKDGIIIDPTLPDNDGVYFPGIRYRGGYGLSLALQHFNNTELPFFRQCGWGGVDSPEFKAALVAAYRHAGCEEMAKWFEEYQPRGNEILPDEKTTLALA
jgi:hypothetical protein